MKIGLIPANIGAPSGEMMIGMAKLAEQYPEGKTIPMPETWGGYRIVPEEIQFWHGRPSRLHDRFRYIKDGGEWRRERLAP